MLKPFALGLALCAGLVAAALPGNPTAATSTAADPYYSTTLLQGVKVDRIEVDKGPHEMRVYSGHRLLKKYKVQLGLNPVGAKQVAGDYKTPEGVYHITSKNAQSLFHKSLAISYPNKDDVQRARQLHQPTGGDIVIHGLPNGEEKKGPLHYRNDWTWGCIALRNEEIDELFGHVVAGAVVVIQP